MTPDEIRTAAEAAEARLARAWLAVVASMRNARTLEELAALLAAGRFDEATQVVVAGARRFAAAWNEEYSNAARATADDIEDALRNASRGEVVISYDMTNDGAVRAMRENQLRLVREVSDQQRRAMRTAMQGGIERGLNPIDQARAFRDSIGLTARQQAAVDNYRRLLETNDPEALNRALRDRRFDRATARAIRNNEPLTRQQIDNMVARYRERAVKHRAEVIARTESLRAVHQGTFGMFKQAVEQGSLTNNELVREWNTAGDERVRTLESTSGKTSHSSMHGQTVRGLEEPFTSGGGSKLLYPGDPSAPGYDTIQCRCAVGVRMDLLAGGAAQPFTVEVLEA
jgi:hypothetical protein